MIRVSSCEWCGETRVEREGVVVCYGCGNLKWPGGSHNFGLHCGRALKLELFMALLRRPGTVATESLLAILYEGRLANPAKTTNTLRVHLCQLRTILAGKQFPGRVESVFGKGYRIVMQAPVSQRGIAA